VIATSASPERPQRPGLTVYLALSRTPQACSILAGPFARALLCQGGLPPVSVVLLGLITVLPATAVYALNDIVDYRSDNASSRAAAGIPAPATWMPPSSPSPGPGLPDPARGHCLVRRLRDGRPDRGLVARPVCAALLVLGCLLETAYCLLLTVSHLRRSQRPGQDPGPSGRCFCRQSRAWGLVSDRPVRLGLHLGDRWAEHPGRLARRCPGSPHRRPHRAGGARSGQGRPTGRVVLGGESRRVRAAPRLVAPGRNTSALPDCHAARGRTHAALGVPVGPGAGRCRRLRAFQPASFYPVLVLAVLVVHLLTRR